MSTTIKGYITFDVEDHDDGELEIHADADGIAEIMDANNIDIDDMIEYFDHIQDVNLATVENYITDTCDHDQISRIVNVCMNRLMADYTATLQQVLDLKREADQAKAELKVLTGGPNVSEIRSSC